MLTYAKRGSRDYARAIAELVATLPPERAAQAYDFARFLQTQSDTPQPLSAEEDDWLSDSEADMQAEDAQWRAIYDEHRPEFLRLREQAASEIASDETQPLFDDRGNVDL